MPTLVLMPIDASVRGAGRFTCAVFAGRAGRISAYNLRQFNNSISRILLVRGNRHLGHESAGAGIPVVLGLEVRELRQIGVV